MARLEEPGIPEIVPVQRLLSWRGFWAHRGSEGGLIRVKTQMVVVVVVAAAAAAVVAAAAVCCCRWR